MTIPAIKNLTYAYLQQLHSDLEHSLSPENSQTLITLTGTRLAILRGLPVSLGDLTEKVTRISREHFSAQTRQAALQVLDDLTHLCDLTNQQVDQMTGLEWAIRKICLFFRETVWGLFRPGLWDPAYKRTLQLHFRAYTAEEYQAEFGVERREQGMIYAKQRLIKAKAEKTQKIAWAYWRALADSIVAERPESEKICYNPKFYQNPTVYLLDQLIHRGTGVRLADELTAFVISRIPRFFETVTSTNYLKAAAAYSDHIPPACQQIFEQSLAEDELLKHLEAAREFHDQGNYSTAEGELRVALDVFRQAREKQLYKTPEEQRPPVFNSGELVTNS